MKKSALFVAVLGTALLLGACGESASKDEPEKEAEKEEVKQEEVENHLEQQGVVDKSDTAKSDDNLEELFAEEEGVSSVNIIVTEDSGGFVLVDFEVVADMEKERAEELANQFAKASKENYPDLQIDVQARKSGETFAGKTIE
ncbi:hypothetical protein [Sporosarcina sp. FSL K6-3457]|uniref:hypothetical protein n=1 Tax=Sporosarcina sp. FSL K6-3457 TaxID=2978204 RepID=UPI0030F7CF7E